MHRLRKAFVVAVTLFIGASSGAAAQDPAASPSPLPLTECTTEPISFEELSLALATPVAAPPSPEASPTAVTLPDGEPADEATTQAVQETIIQLTACLNSGQILSALALYSDRFLQEAFAGFEITQEMYDKQLESKEPRPEHERVLIYSFDQVVIAPDGRAAVVAVGDDLASAGPPSATLFYLAHDGDRWRVDQTAEDIDSDTT